MAVYTLSKSKSILRGSWKIFIKRGKRLSPSLSEKIKIAMIDLQDAIQNHNRDRADQHAKEVEQLIKIHLKRTPFQQAFEGAFGLLFALAIAVVIRQVAFELYEIPSGSMRPTYKEQDRLIVSKTQFGLNIPLTTAHLMFKPNEIKRMGVMIFTGENMDIHNVKTRYFYLFPGYKQFIKRMVGLPGDTLYFYGGKIYGIDRSGKEITKELQLDELNYVEHIPFISIEGKVITSKKPINGIFSPIILHQMNTPLAKLYLSSKRDVHYELLNKPQIEDPQVEKKFDLYQLWGIENYANARILKKPGEPGEYVLELTHHPSILKATTGRDPYFRVRPMVHTDVSTIPLTETHLKKIWGALRTDRFTVENGRIRRYNTSAGDVTKNSFHPQLSAAIPDGSYEFFQGKLYQVSYQGMTTPLPEDHPLSKFDPENLFVLFNAGIECDTRLLPEGHEQAILPARYAYFRDQDLYLMGMAVLSKDDPALKEYVTSEMNRQTVAPNYTPFIDRGPPINADGSLNTALVQTYGIKVPEKHYFVLGDNHAVSADSRDFGFVPEDNIRGVPTFMFWAPGGRYGFLNNHLYPILTTPRLIVWFILLVTFLIWQIYNHRRNRLPLSFE